MFSSNLQSFGSIFISGQPLYAANFTLYYMVVERHLLDAMCDSYACRTNVVALLSAFY